MKRVDGVLLGDRSELEARGVVFPLRLLPAPPRGGDYLAEYEEFQARARQRRGREIFVKAHLVSRFFDELVHHERLLDFVEAVLGPDIALWESDFFVKAPHTDKYVGWHQDTPYYNLSTERVLSVNLALTASDRDNGCLKVVAGTHRRGTIGSIPSARDDILRQLAQTDDRDTPLDNMLRLGQALDFEITPSMEEAVELRPGEASVHFAGLLHASGPNRSDRKRVCYVMRFVSGDTYCKSGKDSAMLVRGRVHHDRFELEPRPKASFDDEALAALERAVSFPSGFADAGIKRRLEAATAAAATTASTTASTTDR